MTHVPGDACACCLCFEVLFELFDVDGNGTIEHEELREVLGTVVTLLRPNQSPEVSPAYHRVVSMLVLLVCGCVSVGVGRVPRGRCSTSWRRRPPPGEYVSPARAQHACAVQVFDGAERPDGTSASFTREDFTTMVESVPLFKDFMQMRVLASEMHEPAPAGSKDPRMERAMKQDLGRVQKELE